ncbi:hypothetical protein ACU01P_004739, partial [Yersinia enterocolitica]
MTTKPTDEEILNAITKFGCRMEVTYVIANRLRLDGFNGLDTSFVRRRLERMEKAGNVKRVQSCYAKMICWEVITHAPEK